jgi:hypothetical protein
MSDLSASPGATLPPQVNWLYATIFFYATDANLIDLTTAVASTHPYYYQGFVHFRKFFAPPSLQSENY